MKSELLEEIELNEQGYSNEYMYIIPPAHVKVVTVKISKGQEVKIKVN